jgi:antitoxin VapB
MMRTVAIFTNGANQAIRIPRDLEFKDVAELEIFREGDALILRPIRPDWLSLAAFEPADDDFLQERPAIVDDEGRFEWL